MWSPEEYLLKGKLMECLEGQIGIMQSVISKKRRMITVRLKNVMFNGFNRKTYVV
jgi:hypothetical protein